MNLDDVIALYSQRSAMQADRSTCRTSSNGIMACMLRCIAVEQSTGEAHT